MVFVGLVVSGALFGLLLAAVASGMSLVYGVMGFLNFSHGEALMFSMYFASVASSQFDVDPLVLLPLCVVAGAATGWVLYGTMMKRLSAGGTSSQIFGTFGLAIALQGVAYLLWGPDFRQTDVTILPDVYRFGSIAIEGAEIASAVVAVVGIAILAWVVNRTGLGLRMRACSQDETAAKLLSISPDRVYVAVWMIACALTAAAGCVLVRQTAVFPTVGMQYAVLSFIVISLGGTGSIRGTLIAGVTLGVLRSLASYYVDPAYAMLPVYALFIISGYVRGMPALPRLPQLRRA